MTVETKRIQCGVKSFRILSVSNVSMQLDPGLGFSGSDFQVFMLATI